MAAFKDTQPLVQTSFMDDPTADSGIASGATPDPSASNPNPFTHSQLENLRHRHLGDIICDNSDIRESRLNVFQFTSDLVSCGSRRERGRQSRLDIDLFLD